VRKDAPLTNVWWKSNKAYKRYCGDNINDRRLHGHTGNI